MSSATIQKSSIFLAGLFLFAVLMISGFDNGRSLQAGAETPTVANFLPLIMQEIDPQPPLSPTNTPIPTLPPATATASPSPIPPSTDCTICSYNAYNCADFSTHNDAQACHDYCFIQVGYDVHQLDGDNDGLACEHLP